MAAEETTAAGERRGDVHAYVPWFVLAIVMVVAGLLLSSRAGDAYTSIAGLLFAAFGVFLGFRVLGRTLP